MDRSTLNLNEATNGPLIGIYISFYREHIE